MSYLLHKQPNQTPKTIFNPALEEFVFTYEKEDYPIAGYDFATHPTYLADKMASALADWYISRYGVRQNYQLDKEELLKEIYIT